jgi:hypothetical protein
MDTEMQTGTQVGLMVFEILNNLPINLLNNPIISVMLLQIQRKL